MTSTAGVEKGASAVNDLPAVARTRFAMDYAFAARMLSALAVIVLVLFGLQLFARLTLQQRLTAGGTRRLVNILETTYLPNAATLHVVKIAEKYVLVGRSGGHIAFLCELPPEQIAAWLASQPKAPTAAAPLLAFVKRLRG